MSDSARYAAPLEALLARLYTDAALLQRFIADADAVIAEAGLDGADASAMRGVDRCGLVMAARSYTKKREARGGRRR